MIVKALKNLAQLLIGIVFFPAGYYFYMKEKYFGLWEIWVVLPAHVLLMFLFATLSDQFVESLVTVAVLSGAYFVGIYVS